MKIKKLAKSFIAAALALSIVAVPPVFDEDTSLTGISVSAAEYYKKVNGFVLSKDKDGIVYVSSYEGKGGNITIPKEAKYIGYSAFEYNTSITGVTFPAGTTKYGVGEGAFSGCINLKNVTFKGDVGVGQNDGIYSSAFQFCHQLRTVIFEEDAHLSNIGEYAFFSCYSLAKISLPADTLLIQEGAFQNCLALASVTIPKKTKIEGSYTFGYMRGGNSSDDYYNAHNNNNYKAILDVKADGRKTVYWQICARTDDEAAQIAKAVFGKSYGYNLQLDDYGYVIDYSFCYPIRQRQITLYVVSGSDAEKWAKSKKISYKASGSTSASVLDAPANLDATKTKNSVTLVWDEVEGADAYRVYMYDSNTGKYKVYKTVSGESCKVTKLKSGTKYKFKVVALKKSGGKYKAGEYATISVTTKK